MINIKSGDEKLHFSPFDILFPEILISESFFFKFIAFYGLVSLEICDINSIAFYDLMHLEICCIHQGSKCIFSSTKAKIKIVFSFAQMLKSKMLGLKRRMTFEMAIQRKCKNGNVLVL